MNNSSDKKDLLTFEWDKTNEKLDIHCSQSGLKNLIKKLEHLLHSTENESTHMMTSDWGGTELSSFVQGTNTVLIHHVKIFNWKE